MKKYISKAAELKVGNLYCPGYLCKEAKDLLLYQTYLCVKKNCIYNIKYGTYHNYVSDSIIYLRELTK